MKQDPHRKPAQKHTHAQGLFSANAVLLQFPQPDSGIRCTKKVLVCKHSHMPPTLHGIMQVGELSRHAEVS